MQRVILALLLPLLLAGCAAEDASPAATGSPRPPATTPEAAATPDPEAPSPSAEDAVPTPDAAVPPTTAARGPAVLQSGCSSFYSQHAVDSAYADARLPDGLAPFPYEGGALFTLKSWTCPATTIDGVSADELAAIVYYIAVTPDAAYDAEHVAFSWYPLEVVTTSPAFADAFAAWGFVVAARGDVEVSWNRAFDPWVVTVAATGRAQVDATLTVPSFASDEGAATIRYFAGDGQRVTGAVDILVHPGARGGGGATLLRLDGEDAPSAAPLRGTSSYQGWGSGELSYTWTPVAFGAEGR